MTLQLGATIRVWLEHWKIYIKKMKCMIARGCQGWGRVPLGLPKHYNIITTFTPRHPARPSTTHSKYKILVPWQELLHGLLFCFIYILNLLPWQQEGRKDSLSPESLDFVPTEGEAAGMRVLCTALYCWGDRQAGRWLNAAPPAWY